MIRHKKRLTGPKALRIFLERNDGTSNAFRAFLKWFLEEKYIRLALSSGEMKSLKEYICFKNEELLPMLL